MNMGEECNISDGGLLTTIGIGLKDRINYAMEGSVFVGGAVIQWLRDELKVINSSKDSESVAVSVEDNGGVYFVPAFTGLGAPYWDMYARGAIMGITRGTTIAHIVRAAVESMGFQSMELLEAIEKESGIRVKSLKVDGGASENSFLMQFQADVAGIDIVRPVIRETTALGAAYLAGLSTGVWSSIDEISSTQKIDKIFSPEISAEKKNEMVSKWKKAIGRTLDWEN